MTTITLSLTGVIDGVQQTINSSGNIDDAILPAFFACFKAQMQSSDGPPVAYKDADAFHFLAQEIANHTASQVRGYAIQKAQEQVKIPTIQVSPS